MRVCFIDTSILCNILPVPGRSQDEKRVKDELRHRTDSGEQFVLPITTVIETGNFIAQMKHGDRRGTAEKFEKILRLVAEGKSPWVLNDIEWNKDFIGSLLDGAGTAMTYVDHADSGLGMGDLCILTERRRYQERSGLTTKIWTLDTQLSAHS